MHKYPTYPKKNNAKRAAIIQSTAEIVGVSQRQVQRVLAGDSKNEKIVETYMELNEGFEKLVDAVKTLVPFN